MLEISLHVLKTLNEHGFEAYIIGGFPRDYYLNIKTDDIDICTNARPSEIKKIFEDCFVKDNKYGVITIVYNDIKMEITTFRSDSNYKDNRHPETVVFVDTLALDLERRDFIINTLCIDYKGNYVDLLKAKKDLDKKIVRTVKKSDISIKEDALRILRAIRFATTLNFKIDKSLEKSILKYGYLLGNIEKYFKEREIIKIVNSRNKDYGLSLLKKYNLLEYLDDII